MDMGEEKKGRTLQLFLCSQSAPALSEGASPVGAVDISLKQETNSDWAQ